MLLDYGTTYGAGTVVHKITMYKAPSGALVFATGTYQWSWGLDANHDRSNLGSTTDPSMQQATVNLFADMGVQPVTLQAPWLRQRIHRYDPAYFHHLSPANGRAPPVTVHKGTQPTPAAVW